MLLVLLFCDDSNYALDGAFYAKLPFYKVEFYDIANE